MSIQPVPETAQEDPALLQPVRGKGPVGGRRPLWLMWPSVALLMLIIGVPFLIAFYISFLNLDQYTLRSWISAPWVGLSNYVSSLVAGNVVGASTLGSLAVSIGFSLLTTLFITPIGILGALTVNTQFRGRA